MTTLELANGQVGFVTCYEYADGDAPDAASPPDATLMGRTLAGLHEAMRSIRTNALPLVAALEAVQPDWDGPTQLLHGDFNTGNVRSSDGVTRVFDFDDCGYGPPAFDVANALYMVLFDDLTGRRPSIYRSFNEAFLSGYCSVSGHELGPDDLHEYIDLRVIALQTWVDEPSTAPVGIRNAPASWHTTLRSFVRRYENEQH